MNNSKFLEFVLQRKRFEKTIPYVYGNVLDFGGNNGELGQYLYDIGMERVIKKYDFTNNIDEVKGKYDVVFILAVIEHIDYFKVEPTIRKLLNHLNPCGKIVITTPSRILKRPLELLANIRLLDQANIKEHKHYWNKDDFGNWNLRLN